MGKGIVKSEKHEYITKQGGFSDAVWNDPELQSYMKGIPFGYIGSSQRTFWADKMTEAALKSVNLGPAGIACWLTSTSGRHLADNIEPGRKDEFYLILKSFSVDAFGEVLIWNHPDHRGSLADSIKLKADVLNWAKKD